MGIYRLLKKGMDFTFGDTKHESVETESLVDDTDGEKWETLREANYEKGDVMPVAHLMPCDSFNLQVSTTSYDRNFSYTLRSSPQSEVLSPTGTLQVGLTAYARVGTDETLTARVVNSSQGDEITGASVQAQTNRPVWSGFAEYTPTDTMAPIRWAIEAKTEPANNASEIQSGPLVLGIKI